jgi:hypothetical protein
MPGDEDDWDLPVCCDELALEIEAALAGHSDIETPSIAPSTHLTTFRIFKWNMSASSHLRC